MRRVRREVPSPAATNDEPVLEALRLPMDDTGEYPHEESERGAREELATHPHLLGAMSVICRARCSSRSARLSGGRKLCNETQVDQYLDETKSKLSIELFVFDSLINLKHSYCTDGKVLSEDISNGQENVPIMAVNEVDDDQPSAFTYRVERKPVAGVHMVIDEPTMTCCSCTDGCRNRLQCACKFTRCASVRMICVQQRSEVDVGIGWLRTLKYADLVGDDRVTTMKAKNKTQAEILYQLGYGFRRLHKNVSSGIYECNSRCSCHRDTCSNRVVQNGIIAQLQVSSAHECRPEIRSFSYSKRWAAGGAYERCTIFHWERSSACIPARYSPVNRPTNEAN